VTTAAATRYVSLLGLGFGDCGKGLFTDHLCGAWQAHTVVRFNGGAQAGHNVVLADGRHHTFSQFGAGSFHAGVATVLASRWWCTRRRCASKKKRCAGWA
jgi:adenylosuccinate synthase